MDESDVKRLIKAASDLRLSEMAKREKDAAKKEQEGLEKQKEKTLDARIGLVTNIGYFVVTPVYNRASIDRSLILQSGRPERDVE